jgi:hypothetical protein
VENRGGTRDGAYERKGKGGRAAGEGGGVVVVGEGQKLPPGDK